MKFVSLFVCSRSADVAVPVPCTPPGLLSSLVVWLMAPALVGVAAILTLPLCLLMGCLLFLMRVRET